MKHVMSREEIGRYVGQLRGEVTQAELASRMRDRLALGPSVISRIESGDRSPSDEELEAILLAIGTDASKEFNSFRSREWDHVPPPAFENPDRETLWRANETMRQSQQLRATKDVRVSLDRQLASYESELLKYAQLLVDSDYRLAFVGSIGVGKTTAICAVAGLETEGSPTEPVLAVGGGGMTICEVHVTEGPQFGFLVDPLPYESIASHVRDFCDYVSARSGDDSGQTDDAEAVGLSHEIQRAIRNMTGLTVRRDRAPDGKRSNYDLAKELAGKYPDSREFRAQVLALLKLERRDRRNIWYASDTAKPPLIWLKETFAAINNGRHVEFSLPARIDLVVPKLAFDEKYLKLRIIDTKGIDQTAVRADLESLFDDPKTILILCSTFNQAPQESLQLLLQRAAESRVSNVTLKVAVLVLPRPGEALAATDESGTRATSDIDGYDLKGEQVAFALSKLGLAGVSVGFLNAMRDSRKDGRDFLVHRIAELRSQYRQRIEELIRSIDHVVANYENAQVLAVIEDAANQLCVWADSNGKLDRRSAALHADLLEAIRSTHASTVRASVRREGNWTNLDFWHHLGSSARRFATKLVAKRVDAFRAIGRNLSSNPKFQEAEQFVNRAVQTFGDVVDELLSRIQVHARTMYSETLKADRMLWAKCEGEWGLGKVGGGYRARIAGRNKEWFEDDSHVELAEKISDEISAEWAKAIENLRVSLQISEAK